MGYTLDDLKRDRDLDEATMQAARQRVNDEIYAWRLREARRASHVTQQALADRMGVSQKRVSVLESGDLEHVEIGTLRRYVQALGGSLELVAPLPDGRIAVLR